MESKPSILGLAVTWLSIPTVLLVIFASTYLPRLLRMLFSKAVREAMLQATGANDIGEVNVVSYAFKQLFEAIPTPVIVLVSIPLVLLVAAWLVLCLVMTYRHFRYQLAVTDIRVIGRAAGVELNASLCEVVNAFVEQSLWGRIFRYGAVTVQTKRRSLTFYNIAHPYEIYGLLMSYAEDYCAH